MATVFFDAKFISSLVYEPPSRNCERISLRKKHIEMHHSNGLAFVQRRHTRRQLDELESVTFYSLLTLRVARCTWTRFNRINYCILFLPMRMLWFICGHPVWFYFHFDRVSGNFMKRFVWLNSINWVKWNGAIMMEWWMTFMARLASENAEVFRFSFNLRFYVIGFPITSARKMMKHHVNLNTRPHNGCGHVLRYFDRITCERWKLIRWPSGSLDLMKHFRFLPRKTVQLISLSSSHVPHHYINIHQSIFSLSSRVLIASFHSPDIYRFWP